MPDRYLKILLPCLGLLSALATGAQAQLAAEDPDWQETALAAPPAFSLDNLLALDMPPYVSLQFGIDPATLSITPDGIVRYVVVASNRSGSISAFYEGIRCAKGEVKTYARTSGNGAWTLVKQAQWRNLSDNQPSRHAIAFARQAACVGATAASSTTDIIRAMNK
jgi:hypothetical protein